jgi:signal transduction histidine kinase/ActR/RegA family two-component response regulator
VTDQGGWQFALDAAGMGTWELDIATGEMRRSPRHDQIFGYDTFQRRWNTTRALAHFLPEDRQRLKHALAEARLTGTIDVEARIKRASDRDIRWLQIRGQTFYERDTAIRIAGVIADVTERRGVEERLRQAQRLEALGQLTGGVAHDFNNLLQVIFGGLQVIANATEPARRDRVTASMKRAVEHGAGLCRQLLAFSRRQPLRPEPVDLARLIGGMREMLGRSLRGDVTVKMEFARRLWPVEVDAGEMELVLLNLALNARDAMPAGGSITIRAYNMPALGDHELAGDYVRVDVIDKGTGMTPEVMAHAFEPFYTTKEVGKGSGLGLAQTHGFARSSAGSVRIHSQPGAGTTVSLYLPRTLKQPQLLVDASERTGDESSPAPTAQVLVVEDDDEVAALTVEMIHQLGYDTTRVSSAEAALGALADQRSVDIVFSDFMMPGMNGIELAREIRRRRPDLPVLLTSGFADAARRSAGAQQIQIISKPYRMDELRDALSSARQDASRAH